MKKHRAALLYSATALTFLGMAHSAEAQWFGNCAGNNPTIMVEPTVDEIVGTCSGQQWILVRGYYKNSNSEVDYKTDITTYSGFAGCQAVQAAEVSVARALVSSLLTLTDCVNLDLVGGGECSPECAPPPPSPPPPSPPPPPSTPTCRCDPTGLPAIPLNQLDTANGECILRFVQPPPGSDSGIRWVKPGREDGCPGSLPTFQ